MKLVNIADAKAQLSELIELVMRGERVVLCKRNEPLAEIRAVAARRSAERPLGLSQGSATILPAFFEPLPDDIVAHFEHPGDSFASEPHQVVAERRAPHGEPGPASAPGRTRAAGPRAPRRARKRP